MPNEVIAQVQLLAIAEKKYDSILFMDMDGNILSEQVTEWVDNNITNNTDIRNMEIDNNRDPMPSEMGAIEEYAYQQPEVTETIEDERASTIDNDEH